MEFNIEVKLIEDKVEGKALELFGIISEELIGSMVSLGLAINRFEEPTLDKFTGELNVSGFIQGIRQSEAPNSTPYGSWTIENVDGVITAEKDNVVYALSYLFVSTK